MDKGSDGVRTNDQNGVMFSAGPGQHSICLAGSVEPDPLHADGNSSGSIELDDRSVVSPRHDESDCRDAISRWDRHQLPADSSAIGFRLEPNYFYPYEILAGALSHLGRHKEAIAAAENAIRLCRDPGPRVYLSYIYGRAGRITEARRIFGELQECAKTQYVSPMMSAAILVALGEFDSALDYLEKCQEVREQDIVFIRSFPAWRPLHGHPRFQELVRRMKFPD